MATRLYFHNTFYPRYTYGIYSNVGGFNQGFKIGGVSVIIAFDNNRFIASTGYAGELIISSDGSDWEKITITGMSILNCATYVSALGWWIIGDQSGHIYTSPDLVNWTLRSSTLSTITIENITYANGIAVAACKNSVNPNCFIYTSTDAITWTSAGTTNFANTEAAYAATYSPTLNLWVVAGGAGRVNYTSNPAAGVWTASTSGTGVSIYAMIWDATNSRFFGVGSGGTWCSSTNGTTWTTGTNGGTTTMYNIVNFNGTYLTCGASGTVWKTSNGGTNWTTILINSGIAVDSLYAVCKGVNATDAYVVGGIGTLYKSTDTGTTWTTAGGELATASQTTFNAINSDANTLKLMDTRTGPRQTSHTFTSGTLATTNYASLAMFASAPLTANATVGGGALTLNIAHSTNTNAMQFNASAFNIYVWRPSTKTKVGTVKDVSQTAQNATLPGTTESTAHVTGITTTAVSALAGDVIICEIWAVFTPTMGTSYVGNFFFDGTVVTTTNNTAVTNHASFIEFTENFTLTATNTGMQQMF